MANEETIELFTLFDIFPLNGSTPFVSAAIGQNVAAFGSPTAFEGAGAVAIYVYRRELNAWGYVGYFQGAGIGSSNDIRSVGRSVVIAGDTIVIGAAGDDHSPGRVIICSPPYGVWTYGSMPEFTVLTSPTPDRDDGFGTSVACCHDGTDWYVAVGAPNAQPGRGPFGVGAAYVFKGLDTSNAPISGSWAFNPEEGTEADSRFGASVAINAFHDEESESRGVILAVGAPGAKEGQGAVYVGSGPAGDWPSRWTYGQCLEPKFPDFVEDFRTSEFGTSIALGNGRVLAVGSPNDPNFELEIEGTGAAWIYVRKEEGFELVQEGGSMYGKEESALFGTSLAFPSVVPGDDAPPLLAVGIPGMRNAHVFSTEDGSQWEEEIAYSCYGGKAGDKFGSAVSIVMSPEGAPWTVVGAPGDPSADLQSGGYLYAEGTEDMRWLPAPTFPKEPNLGWMVAAATAWAKYTPDPETYLS